MAKRQGASLPSILFMTFHLSDEIVEHAMAPAPLVPLIPS